jgi:hypothetical protein
MSAHRTSLALLAFAGVLTFAPLGACSPAVSADAPVVTYYYIPG